MKKCDSNIDVRINCEHNEPFKKKFIAYMRSLKNVPFSILQPAAENDINYLGEAIGELDEVFPNMDNMDDKKKVHQYYLIFSRTIVNQEYIFSS